MKGGDGAVQCALVSQGSDNVQSVQRFYSDLLMEAVFCDKE